MSNEYYGAEEGSYRVPTGMVGIGDPQTIFYRAKLLPELLADDSFSIDEFMVHARNSTAMNNPEFVMNPVETTWNDDGSVWVMISGVKKE